MDRSNNNEMHVLNIHKRVYNHSKDKISLLLDTLSTKEDMVWPNENWPKMKLDSGLSNGSSGGHGPIRYFVESYYPNKHLVFRFTKPIGFDGIHKFDLFEINPDKTELVHTIDVQLSFKALLLWYTTIKWLHDALIEDGFDKLHNHLNGDYKKTDWNIWVQLLRKLFR